MRLSRDEALRYIRFFAENWEAAEAELAQVLSDNVRDHNIEIHSVVISTTGKVDLGHGLSVDIYVGDPPKRINQRFWDRISGGDQC